MQIEKKLASVDICKELISLGIKGENTYFVWAACNSKNGAILYKAIPRNLYDSDKYDFCIPAFDAEEIFSNIPDSVEDEDLTDWFVMTKENGGLHIIYAVSDCGGLPENLIDIEHRFVESLALTLIAMIKDALIPAKN